MSRSDAGSFPWQARTLLGLRSSPENRPVLGRCCRGAVPTHVAALPGEGGTGLWAVWPSRRRPEVQAASPAPGPHGNIRDLVSPTSVRPAPTSAMQPRVVTRGVAEGARDEDWTGAPCAIAQGRGVTESLSAHPPTRKAPHSPRAPLDLPSEPPLIPGISASLSRAEVGWGEEMKQGEEGVLPTRAAWKAAAAGSGGG